MKSKKIFLDFLAIVANLCLLPTLIIEWVVKNLIKNFSEEEKKKMEDNDDDMVFKSGDDAIAYLGATAFTSILIWLLDGIAIVAGKIGSAAIVTWKYIAKAITSEYPWEANWYSTDQKNDKQKITGG